MAEEFYYILFITLLQSCCYPEVEGNEVAVVLGGYPTPDKTGTPFSQTEFFTERQESCVHTEEFLNISAIFDYSWGQSNSLSLMGVFVPDRGIFACPADCVSLGPSRLQGTTWQSLPCRNDQVGGMGVDCSRTDGLAPWQDDLGFIHFSKAADLSPNTLVYTASQDFMDRRANVYMNSENCYLILNSFYDVILVAYAVNCLAKVRALNNNYWYMYAHSEVVEYGYCRDESCSCNSIACDSWVEGSFTITGLTTFVSYPCTVFEDGGREYIMMMDSTNYWIVQNHLCSGEHCEWDIMLTGQQNIYYSSPNPDPWNCKMVTLDNVPYFFNEASIFKYEKGGSWPGSWTPVGNSLQNTRFSPLVLSVPEDWLCYGNSRQLFTSTTTTTSSVTSTTTTLSSTTMISTSTTTTNTPTTTTTTTNTNTTITTTITTSTSIMSSTMLTSTGPSCPSEGRCVAVDGRGVLWEGKFWLATSKSCGLGMSGSASWWCDGCTGTFRSPQPDRSNCVQQWVDDIKDQVATQDRLIYLYLYC